MSRDDSGECFPGAKKRKVREGGWGKSQVALPGTLPQVLRKYGLIPGGAWGWPPPCSARVAPWPGCHGVVPFQDGDVGGKPALHPAAPAR